MGRTCEGDEFMLLEKKLLLQEEISVEGRRSLLQREKILLQGRYHVTR
jgi:hypothetical protein